MHRVRSSKTSDLIKISISDTGRDKRTGVLIRGESHSGVIGDDDNVGSLANVIRKDLIDNKIDSVLGGKNTAGNDIGFSSEESDGDGISLYQGAGENSSAIESSGSWTLNFTRNGKDNSDSPAIDWQFDPGDFKVEGGDAVVRFYGCLHASICDPDPDNAGDTDKDDDIKLLSDYLTVDEDRSNGEASGNTAPWLRVNASVPTNKKYYSRNLLPDERSRELGWSEEYWTCADDANSKKVSPTKERIGDPAKDSWQCGYTSATSPGTAANKTDSPTNVVYTSSEKDKNTALMVEATGGAGAVNLVLKEAERFNGRYVGYLRLTDQDGIGEANDAANPGSWGRKFGHGDQKVDLDSKGNLTADSAAVVKVRGGLVTITYRDSDGTDQKFVVQIDTQAPTIEVSAPANGSSSDDQSPDFSGTIQDSGSGLVDESFRLVIDNKVDNTDGGPNSDFALDPYAPNADDVGGSGTDGLGRITHIGQYSGYKKGKDGDKDRTRTLGVRDASKLYYLGDDSCDRQDVCHIESDAYDDGAARGTFDESISLDLRDGNEEAVIRDKEYMIDFQAFVMDMAGNIGFSDSDAANPRFINALGEEKDADRGINGKKGMNHNVLGYYSAHVIKLDEKDPVIKEASYPDWLLRSELERQACS